MNENIFNILSSYLSWIQRIKVRCQLDINKIIKERYYISIKII